jgi:hypothetical protein
MSEIKNSKQNFSVQFGLFKDYLNEKDPNCRVEEVNGVIFVQMIIPTGDSYELRLEISQKFIDVVGSAGLLWTVEIYSDHKKIFAERVRLQANSSARQYGFYSNGLEVNDAYVKISKFDAQLLDYPASIEKFSENGLKIDCIQDDRPGFESYSLTPDAQYSELELFGTMHKILTPLKLADKGEHIYTLKVRPTEPPNLFMG